jgi:hypothetical protein
MMQNNTMPDPIPLSERTANPPEVKSRRPQTASVEDLKAHIERLQPPFRQQPVAAPPVDPDQSRFLPVHGFAQVHDTACGPTAIATVLNYWGYGWTDIPRDANGQPSNDEFVRRVMAWSGTPDTWFGWFGTTPMRIHETFNRLNGLGAWWGRKYSPDETWDLIKREIDADRPVIVLVDYGQIGQGWYALDWQVVFGYDGDDGGHVWCKVGLKNNSGGNDQNTRWRLGDFFSVLQNNMPLPGLGQSDWNRSFIEVYRSQPK